MSRIREDRKNQIKNACIDLVAEKGIQNLTMKNLSLVIGISEPAIYRYYENKFQMIMAILDSFEDETEELLSSSYMQAKPPIEQVEAFIMDRYSRCEQYPNLAKVLFSEEHFQYDERMARKALDLMEENNTHIKEIIEQCQKDGSIRKDIDSKTMLTLIFGPVRLLIKQWGLRNRKFDLVKRGKELWNAQKKTLKPTK